MVIGNFADNAYQREQYENADTQQNEQPRMLCFCFNAHRKSPPNKVPPSSRFKVARTASLPNTVPQSASTARITLDINMILLYHVYVINITKVFIIVNRQLVKCDKGAKM